MCRFVSAAVFVVCAICAADAGAADFVPIRVYQERGDSPFPDFGIDGRIVVEDFEGERAPGISISSKNVASIKRGFSVKSDVGGAGSGLALEVTPGACATSWPPQCPSTVSLTFDESVFGTLPTYAGFVWTDAVRAAETDIHPWARVNLTNGAGQVTGNLINQLPLRAELEDEFADDTLIAFVDERGIRQLDITIVTDGSGRGGHFAIDHLQYGVSALAGDANVDGAVNFADFARLAENFGSDGTTWRDADFTFDSRTGFPDFVRLAFNFGRELEITPSPVDNVPEPSSATLFLLATMIAGLCRRRIR